jgi:hypothetical protein
MGKMNTDEVTTSSRNDGNTVLGEGFVKYYVRWRHIPIDMMFTPLMHISIDHTVVEAKPDANDWDIALAVVQELPMLNIRPDDVRIESRQPCT